MAKYKDYVPKTWLCKWTGVSRSNWYYAPTSGERGCRPSTCTYRIDGSKVGNNQVVDEIRNVMRDEFIASYGYERLTWELHELGYHINKKKVYRLMKEASLLNPKHRIHTTGQRQFVQQWSVYI